MTFKYVADRAIQPPKPERADRFRKEYFEKQKAEQEARIKWEKDLAKNTAEISNLLASKGVRLRIGSDNYDSYYVHLEIDGKIFLDEHDAFNEFFEIDMFKE